MKSNLCYCMHSFRRSISKIFAWNIPSQKLLYLSLQVWKLRLAHIYMEVFIQCCHYQTFKTLHIIHGYIFTYRRNKHLRFIREKRFDYSYDFVMGAFCVCAFWYPLIRNERKKCKMLYHENVDAKMVGFA